MSKQFFYSIISLIVIFIYFFTSPLSIFAIGEGGVMCRPIMQGLSVVGCETLTTTDCKLGHIPYPLSCSEVFKSLKVTLGEVDISACPGILPCILSNVTPPLISIITPTPMSSNCGGQYQRCCSILSALCKNGFTPITPSDDSDVCVCIAVTTPISTPTPTHTSICSDSDPDCFRAETITCNPKTGRAGSGGVSTAIGCIPTEPTALVQGIIKVAIGAGGGIALLLMIYGAFLMITSAGNPDGVKKGHEQITSAVIGLLFIIFAVMLLKVVGVDILQIPGFSP